MVICKICNKKINHSIYIHVRRKHNISPQLYYDRYLRNYRRDEGFCLECGKETKIRNIKYGYNNFCSTKCSNNSKITQLKYKQTMISQYRVENSFQSEEIKEKIKETNLHRYGVEHIFQLKEIKEKRKQTMIERYGVKYPCQSKEIKQKRKQTNLDRYGVEYTLQLKEIREKIKETLLKKNNIGFIDNKPLYSYFNDKINWIESTRNNNSILEVRCKKCGKWFIPNKIQLQNRIQVLNGNRGTVENNLYCSENCKNSCSIFGQQLYPKGQNPNIDRPYQQDWSKQVKEIAGNKCEICESTMHLQSHHILPVKTHPHLQADIDNGICLCNNCHSKYGHSDECSTGNLARKIC